MTDHPPLFTQTAADLDIPADALLAHPPLPQEPDALADALTARAKGGEG